MSLRKTIHYLFFVLLIVVLPNRWSLAQNPERQIKPPETLNASDTVPRRSIPREARIKNDSLLNQNSADTVIRGNVASDFETTINYFAKDSVINDLQKRTTTLYGDAKIIYGEMQLQANSIVIDLDKNTVQAEGKLDSAGRRVGFPVFINGDETYETKRITYNIKTKQARIDEVVTTQGDGYIHGETVFKNERDEILSIRNTYTTCNLAHPHYRIISTKTKAIPDDKIVSGPFNLEILDVPTPLGFPFGMFPAPRKSSSGIIIPEYGEEARRGFFLRNGGYFFDINEYIKMQVTGSVFSKGSLGMNVRSSYRKRYRYSGSFDVSVTKNVIPEPINNPTSSTDYAVNWSHTPQSRGTGKFSARVNAATSTFSQNNYLGVNYDLNSSRFDNTTRNLNSAITYTKQFRNTPFSMGVSARHSQDLANGQVDLTLPDFYATMRSIYPFKKATKAEILKNINLRYNLKTQNQISNRIFNSEGTRRDSVIDFSLENLPQLLEQPGRGISHSLPLSTSFNLSYLNISPSINYEERWYFESVRWGLSEDSTRAVIVDTVSGFNRPYSYNLSVGMNTRIYGNYLFDNPRIPAMRHTVNPSISYTYSPDFSREEYGFYDYVLTYPDSGVTRMERKSRTEGFSYFRNTEGESQTIGLSIGNTLEIKVLEEMDSTSRDQEPKYRKVPLFRNFSFTTGYNFAADSFKLSNIRMNTNTSVFDNTLTISANATLDPYTVIQVQPSDELEEVELRKIDQLALRNGSLGRITNASLQLNTNLNPAKREQENSTAEKIMNSNLSEADKNFLLNNPEAFVDFEIPWSLRLGYVLRYTNNLNRDAAVTQTLTVSGDISLSEKWKVGFRSGYDFTKNEFSMTNFQINRDLHCWQLSMDWTPFGRFTQYNFTLNVKSNLLSDLKLNRRRNFFDTGF